MRKSNKWSALPILAALVLGWGDLALAAIPDETPPTDPTNFRVTGRTDTSISLAWNASSDNRGVTGYYLTRCLGSSCSSAMVLPASPTTRTDTGLTSGATYSYYLSAFDAAGNQSNTVDASGTTLDSVAPSAPTGLSASPHSSGSQMNLSWNASTDNVGVAGYAVEWCAGSGCSSFSQHGTTASTGYAVTGLSSGAYYQFRVRAFDTASPANYGGYSGTAGAATVDVNPPSAPASLGATVISGSRIDLSWPVASDNVAVAYYEVEYCAGINCSNFVGLASPGGTNYSATSLSPATHYNFRVRARDTSNLTGGYSPTASGVTLDTVPPSAPTNVSATPATSGTQINLNWSPSSDNVAVAGYAVEWCAGSGCSNFTQHGTTGSTSYSVASLTSGAPYRFRLRAYDTASPANYSGYSAEAAATTRDVLAPGTPVSLSANAPSASQIDLSWSGVTDNVAVTLYSIERCQGAGCSGFAEVATTTTTTYSNTSLPDATTYRYRVRARDAEANYGGYSPEAQAMTRDGTAPQVPTNLSAVAVSGTRIDLTWTAPTDNVGVTGYAVERCAGQGCTNYLEIAAPTSASYSDTTVANGAWYRYRVRARDAAANWSGYAGPVERQTNDTQAPTAPTGLGATPVSPTQINLNWTASTDNNAVALYSIERCTGAACTNFLEVGTTASISFNNTGLTPGTTYRYQVRARDVAVNWSGYAGPINATTSSDTQAPTVPTGVSATAASATQINLTWTASSDNIGVAGYVVERCQGSGCTGFAQVATPTATNYSDTGRAPNTLYRYQVRARDGVPNTSGPSSPPAQATTPPDSSAPSTPGSLGATSPSPTQVNLTWQASTDNVGVTGYIVERCEGTTCTSFAQIGTPTTTSYNDTGRTPNTAYRYQVRARDAAGNQSGNAGPILWTTPQDIQAPTSPSNLRSTGTTISSISLAWDPSADNVGVTSYRIERCQGSSCSNFTEVGSTSSTTFTSGSLTHSTTYRFRVRARDGANLNSGYTSILTVNTNDGQAPTTPSNLTLVVELGRIRLNWNASTDNIGVTAYLVERCNLASCTYAEIASTTSTNHTDTGVASATNYSYRVRARGSCS